MLGGLSQANGQQEAAQQQAAQLRQNQQTAEYNAKIFEMQAERSMQESTVASNVMARRAQSYIANQTARQAQNNYFGQSADMLVDQSAANAEMDRLNIAYQGEAAAKGAMSQAAFARYQGSIAESQIQPVLNAGSVNAGSSLIGTIGKIGTIFGGTPISPFLNFGKF